MAKIYSKAGEKMIICAVREAHYRSFQATDWVDLRVGFFLSLTQAGADDTTTGLSETISGSPGVAWTDRFAIGLTDRATSSTFLGYSNLTGAFKADFFRATLNWYPATLASRQRTHSTGDPSTAVHRQTATRTRCISSTLDARLRPLRTDRRCILFNPIQEQENTAHSSGYGSPDRTRQTELRSSRWKLKRLLAAIPATSCLPIRRPTRLAKRSLNLSRQP